MQGVKNGVFFSIPVLMHGGLLYLVFCLSVCLSVCLSLLRLHYTPLQRYMGYLCTMRAQYAPPRRNMHHGAQGGLYFLKNSGDPDPCTHWGPSVCLCLSYVGI